MTNVPAFAAQVHDHTLPESRRAEAAILADAQAHDGRIDPNRVRVRLAGSITAPRVVGQAYSRLRRATIIRLSHATENDATARRRAGTPARCYALTKIGRFMILDDLDPDPRPRLRNR